MEYQLIIDDYIGSGAYSTGYVQSVLSALQGQPVHVKICSYGGELSHALDIRRQFAEHGDVHAHITGLTASAATIIAMGAKTVAMDEHAFFLVHKTRNYVSGDGFYNADELEQLIDGLIRNREDNDKMDKAVVSIYAQKCGCPEDKLMALLKDERWLTAAEALEYGFIDTIESTDANNAQRLSMAKLNAFGLTGKGLPEMKQTDSPKTNDMPLTPKITELLALEEPLEVQPDDKVLFEASHISAIENALEQNQKSLAGAMAKIDELTEQVQNLSEQCPEQTETVMAEDTAAHLTSNDFYNQIKHCL